jgi:hypothetical protein
MNRAPVNSRKLLTWLGLAVGIGGLLLQFVLSMQAYLANGRDIPGALGAFFAYYTILTNIALVLIYASEVLPSPLLNIFRNPIVRGSMAACIALVSIYVFFVLRFLYVLAGPLQLADTLLHYVAPLLYLLWWLIAQPHGQLRWPHLPVMLVPTFVYFIAIMARGIWVQEYPYPFMEVGEFGYGGVLLSALNMTLGLAILAAIVIAADKVLSRNWNLVHE